MKTSQKIMNLFKDIARRNSVGSLKRKRSFIDFCDKFGLVYFGTVDQRQDEHKIIRGLTASPMHVDENFCVGSIDGHDVSLVYRTDSMEDSTGASKINSWLILAIELIAKDLPHIFIGGHDHRSSPYTKLFLTHSQMQKVPLDGYSDEFMSRYSIYSHASHFVEARDIFNLRTTQLLAAHFWPLAIELHEGTLYIYSDNREVTSTLLDTVLKNGLWLADRIENREEV